MADANIKPRGRPRTYAEERGSLTIRLTDATRAVIANRAARSRRSLCGEIEFILDSVISAPEGDRQ